MATNSHISVRGAQRRTFVAVAHHHRPRGSGARQEGDHLRSVGPRRGRSVVPLACQAVRPAAPRSRELRRSANDVPGLSEPPRRPLGRTARAPSTAASTSPRPTDRPSIRSCPERSRTSNGEWVKVESGGGRPSSTGTSTRCRSRLARRGVPDRDRPHLPRLRPRPLTEVDDGRYVNPLAPGHLGPYTDHTTPRVTSISLRAIETRGDGLPNLVRGRVILVAAAEDEPTIDAPEAWRGLPLAPALLTWEIRSWNGGSSLGRRSRGRLPWRRCRTAASGGLRARHVPEHGRPRAATTRGRSRARTCSS